MMKVSVTSLRKTNIIKSNKMIVTYISTCFIGLFQKWHTFVIQHCIFSFTFCFLVNLRGIGSSCTTKQDFQFTQMKSTNRPQLPRLYRDVHRDTHGLTRRNLYYAPFLHWGTYNRCPQNINLYYVGTKLTCQWVNANSGSICYLF